MLLICSVGGIGLTSNHLVDISSSPMDVTYHFLSVDWDSLNKSIAIFMMLIVSVNNWRYGFS